MDTATFLGSKKFKAVLWCIGGLFIALVIFKAGVIVGFKKARFSYRWAEDYHQNFGGSRKNFFEGFSDRDSIGGHGVVGKIIAIDDQSLIMEGRDNTEKIVTINFDTTITRRRDTMDVADLALNDTIVVIGTPNDTGQIEAKFIRVLPAPSMRRR